MNKLAHLGFLILESSKILMCRFWYDYVNSKYNEKAKLCYMDTHSFIAYIKIDDIYKDTAEEIETRFDTSNYELDRPLPNETNKKVIGLMKNELDRKFMIKFAGLRSKTYSYLIDDSSEGNKGKRHKKVCHEKNNLNLKIIKSVWKQLE